MITNLDTRMSQNFDLLQQFTLVILHNFINHSIHFELSIDVTNNKVFNLTQLDETDFNEYHIIKKVGYLLECSIQQWLFFTPSL